MVPIGGPLGSPAVGIAVTDPIAAACCETACRRVGATPNALASSEDLPAAVGDLRALLYDGLPFDGALGMLRKLRRRHPDLPIVLYPPLQAQVVPLLLTVDRVPQVSGIGQSGTAADVDQLAALLERRLLTAPARMVMGVIDSLHPDLPERPRAFVQAVLRARVCGEPCTVLSVSRAIGAHPDRLRRRWPCAPFPKPKDLVNWVTLLYATYTKEWSCVGWGAIARAIGVDETTLRRLRKRYGRAGDGCPNLVGVLLAFGARCRVPVVRVSEVASELHAARAVGGEGAGR